MSKRRTHPLKAWRMTQRVWDDAKRGWRMMSVADAARGYGVGYTTWRSWERYSDEPDSRIPDAENMVKLHRFTRGKVRPNDFYDLPDLRAEAAAEEAA